MIKEIAQNKYYSVNQDVYAPRPYYQESVTKDTYSKKIFFSKDEDQTHYILKPVKELISKLKMNNILEGTELITIIPRGKVGCYSVTLNRIANSMSFYLNIPYEKIIQRIKNSRQSETRAEILEERYESVKDSMEINRSLSENKILLLDDVKTSGCTILEAQKILKDAGVHEIVCVCFGINQTTVIEDFKEEVFC